MSTIHLHKAKKSSHVAQDRESRSGVLKNYGNDKWIGKAGPCGLVSFRIRVEVGAQESQCSRRLHKVKSQTERTEVAILEYGRRNDALWLDCGVGHDVD